MPCQRRACWRAASYYFTASRADAYAYDFLLRRFRHIYVSALLYCRYAAIYAYLRCCCCCYVILRFRHAVLPRCSVADCRHISPLFFAFPSAADVSLLRPRHFIAHYRHYATYYTATLQTLLLLIFFFFFDDISLSGDSACWYAAC